MAKNLQLEGLRGFAALWVFGAHFLMWEFFYPNGKLINTYFTGLLTSFTPGHLGVLYFFVLSGYVIGKAYPWDRDFLVSKYLMRRWVRIWLMYLISVLFSCAVSPSNFWQAIGHLVFLNPDLVPPISGNPVLWSISYEFWFYLFLPIVFAIPFLRQNKAIPVLILSAITGIISLYVSPDMAMIFRWLNGLFFWIVGLVIAWKVVTKENSKVDDRNLWAGLFLSMALSNCTAALIAMARSAGLPETILGSTTPSIGDIVYLPTILIVFFCSIEAKVPKRFKEGMFYSSLIIVALIIAASFKTGKFWTIQSYPAALSLSLLALVTKFNRLNLNLESLAPIGAISYGIYIFHMPMMLLIGKIPLLSGDWIEWFMRAMGSIFATFLVAYIVEIRLQPRLKDFFMRPK
jgi:peptidoglycan/LPS O-acetylase OafA/YrhL